MFTVSAANGRLRVEMTPTPPGVYLDHGVMGQIAESVGWCERFVAQMQRRGTLLISPVSIFEMANQGPGRSMDALRVLLAGVGPAFLFVETNFGLVHERMLADPQLPEAAASCDMPTARTFVDAMATRPGPMSAADLVPFAVAQHDAMRPVVATLKGDITGLVQNARAAFRHLGAGLVAPPTTAPASLLCWHDLLAAAFRADAPFTPNDSFDIFHAAVPLAVSDFVLLDGGWQRRATNIPKPPRRAEVFSGKKGQIDAFLDALESWPAPPPEAK